MRKLGCTWNPIQQAVSPRRKILFGGSEYCAQKFDRPVDKNRQTKIDRFWDPPILAKKMGLHYHLYGGVRVFWAQMCPKCCWSIHASFKKSHHRKKSPSQTPTTDANLGRNWPKLALRVMLKMHAILNCTHAYTQVLAGWFFVLIMESAVGIIKIGPNIAK